MTSDDMLDAFADTYPNDPFRHENEMMLNRFAARCMECSADRQAFLELGIGHGITLARLSVWFSRILIVEGSAKLIQRYAGRYRNVEIQEAYFETFETYERVNHIGMGFVLEHVDDPAALLRKYRCFLKKDGSIFVGVPSASSLHRILALKAGMLRDIRQLSETDLKFGHKRYLTFDDWLALFKKEGFCVVRAEGLSLKPFSTAQLESLHLDPKVFSALVDIAGDYPEISNTLFFEVKYDR